MRSSPGNIINNYMTLDDRTMNITLKEMYLNMYNKSWLFIIIHIIVINIRSSISQ